MKRPSAKMLHVLERMRDGWELGYSRGVRASGRHWLQHGGIGRGGQSEDVLAGTVNALLRRRLVLPDKRQDLFEYPKRFILADAGRAALEAEEAAA